MRTFISVRLLECKQIAAFWWQYELKLQENTKDLSDRVLPAVQWLSVRLVACLIFTFGLMK